MVYVVAVVLLAVVLGFIWYAFRTWAQNGPEPQCGTCAHFDLEEGQAAFAANPIFKQATQHVSPQRMANRIDEDGNPTHKVPEETDWDEFGLCHKRRVLVWAGTQLEDKGCACAGIEYKRRLDK